VLYGSLISGVARQPWPEKDFAEITEEVRVATNKGKVGTYRWDSKAWFCASMASR
jgi:hypothetical protein